MSMTSRVQSWWVSAWGERRPMATGPVAAEDAPDLACIRQAMLEAMASCTEAHRSRAAVQIARAGTVIELWLLRPSLYQSLAQDMGETAARQRVGELLPLFKDAVPAATSTGPFTGSDGRRQRLH